MHLVADVSLQNKHLLQIYSKLVFVM